MVKKACKVTRQKQGFPKANDAGSAIKGNPSSSAIQDIVGLEY